MEPAPPPADTCLPLRHPEALHEDLQPVHGYHACESQGFLGRGYLEVGLVQTPARGQVMRRQEAFLPFFFKKKKTKKLFPYFWLCRAFIAASLGFSLGVESRGYSLVAVRGLLIAGASLVSEDRLCGLWRSWHVGSVVVCPGLQSTGFIVVVHRLSFSEACGIFLDRD